MSFLPHHLHNRMLVAITLAMLLGTLGLSFWTAASQSGQLHVARLQQAKLLSNNLAEGCAHALSIEDYAALDQFLRNASGVPGLRKVVALDASGIILTAFKRASDTDLAELIDEHEVLKAPATIQQTEQTNGAELVIWQPVQAGGLLGWLQLTFSHDDIAQMQSQIWRNGIIAAFSGVVLGIGLVGLMLRRPLHSISRLSSFARELPLHKGATVPVERYVSEVQDLGESLNYASTELCRIEQELLELNRTLEGRIEEEVAKSREKDTLLLQQARYQTLGELLVNIAHHWRQPLNNIGARVQENAWQLTTGELLPENAMAAADLIMQDLKQLSRSIEAFNLLCRPALPDQILLPSDAVQRAIQMVQDSYQQSGISFELKLIAEQALQGSLQDLVQCVLNIFSNARDAIMAGHEDGGLIRVEIDVQEQKFVTIAIADTGGGIPQQLLHSLFDPYVTSKFRTQGVGLGLFVVRQIIEQRFNGTVTAANQGSGAVLTIAIPLRQENV
ncbi:HAMP domain-containing histidine kinase [Trichlorobacter lovleyi]|uniref:sensor histidine kinase n=1 Tax=Trichlorobacter lovleyi TaxID=313985 RepID=UPI00223EA8F5|nr:HAMP domain-containing sensor histidine kinase [Trichlorobacter lovleyi]QOX77792.1 HAMP domain-containing histidine kinase [Trichlorobacter lovleyi]